MNNSSLKGKEFTWVNVGGAWDWVLRDVTSELIKIESRAIIAIKFEAKYGNTVLELRRRQLPPLDLTVKDVALGKTLCVVHCNYGMNLPAVVEMIDGTRYIMSGLLRLRDKWFVSNVLSIMDTKERTLAVTSFDPGSWSSSGKFMVRDAEDHDPDILLIASMCFVVALISFHESTGPGL